MIFATTYGFSTFGTYPAGVPTHCGSRCIHLLWQQVYPLAVAADAAIINFTARDWLHLKKSPFKSIINLLCETRSIYHATSQINKKIHHDISLNLIRYSDIPHKLWTLSYNFITQFIKNMTLCLPMWRPGSMLFDLVIVGNF